MVSLLHTLGLPALHAAGRDAYLILLARGGRMIAHGGSSLILASFLAALGTSDARIGLFMTLTLAGDLALSLALTLVADRWGRRRVLLLGGALMAGSGVAFAVSERYVLLLCAATAGVLSVTGGDFGPFRAVEESVLAQLAGPRTRADVLTWYVTVATLGSAGGTAAAGAVVRALREGKGWDLRRAGHVVFAGYVGMGVLGMACAGAMSERCEVDAGRRGKGREGEEEAGMRAEGRDAEAAEGLLREAEAEEEEEEAEDSRHVPQPSASYSPSTSVFARISRPTLRTVWPLWLLLAMDSLADGMASYALTSYYLTATFPAALPAATLGRIFLAAHLLGGLSTVLAAPLARRLGLIRTMVFTHLPSSVAVLLFPLPRHPWAAVALLLVRAALNSMDQAPRAAFIAAVVPPHERTAVMGLTGLLRTLAATVGPSLTGGLAESGRFGLAFAAAGLLRVVYDLGLWAVFVKVKVEGEGEGEGEEDLDDDAEREEGEEVVELEPVRVREGASR